MICGAVMGMSSLEAEKLYFLKVSTCTSDQRLTSTPNDSECTCDDPGVSMIEKSVSAPILVSDASVADLSCYFKICSPSKSSLRDITTSTCPVHSGSPRRARFEPRATGVQVQVPKDDKAGCVEELYFNECAKKSGASSPGAPCVNEECQAAPARSTCSTTMVKAEECGRCKEPEPTCIPCDIPKDNSDSCTPVCDANARAQYYHNKLMSTLQILQNKEETIRVQTESLIVAEARIATLTDRATDLRKEWEKKMKECQKLKQALDCCKVEKADVCVITEQQDDRSDIVSTLQNNLSVIEELYRECFYETVKQDHLIDMLRNSFLDVRLMDKRKAEHIEQLNHVICKQKTSIDTCQDMALEVENLKLEISNFLHSSSSTNYDSGMWERSEDSLTSVPGAQEELQDIMTQLLRLQDMLVGGCTCGLLEENEKLKKELTELREEMCCLSCGMQEEITNLKKDNQDLKTEKCNLLEDNKDLKQEILDLLARECSCGLLEENKKLKKEIQELSVDTCCLSEDNRKLKMEIDELRAEGFGILEENKKVKKEIKELCAERCACLEDNKKLKNEVQGYNTQMCDVLEENKKLRKEVKDLKAELCKCDLVEQNEKLKKEIQDLKVEHCALLEENKKWRVDLQDLKAESDSLLEQNKKLTKDLKKLLMEACTCDLEAENKKIKKKVEELCAERCVLSEENKKLKKEIHDLKARDCTCGLLEENKRLKKEIQELKGRDCTCGLLDENKKLKKKIQELSASESCSCGLRDENGKMQSTLNALDLKVAELRGKLCELECALVTSNEANQKYKDEMFMKEQELRYLRNRLSEVSDDTEDQMAVYESMKQRLKTLQCQLEDKNAEMMRLQEENTCKESTIDELNAKLEKAEQLIKENCKIRSEVSYLTSQVSVWRAQLSDSERRVHQLEEELQRANDKCAHIDAFYREKASTVAELQARLEEAHSRGAALCGETRHAICAVRQWMRRMREKHRDQENTIKEKEALIQQLQQCLEERHNDSQRTASTSDSPSCSKCQSSREERSVRCARAGARRALCGGVRIDDVPGCSSAPVPPISLVKKPACSKRCKAWCDASIQLPVRRESGQDAPSPQFFNQHDVRHVRVRLDRPRDASPTEELFRRVEQLTDAMADGHRRWTRNNNQR